MIFEPVRLDGYVERNYGESRAGNKGERGMSKGDRKEQWDRDQSFKKKVFLVIKYNRETIRSILKITSTISA